MKLNEKKMVAAGKLEDLDTKGQQLNRKQRRFLASASKIAERKD